MGHCKLHDVRWIDKEESTNECYRCVFDERNFLRKVYEDADVLMESLDNQDKLTGKIISNPKVRYRLFLTIREYKRWRKKNEKK